MFGCYLAFGCNKTLSKTAMVAPYDAPQKGVDSVYVLLTLVSDAIFTFFILFSSSKRANSKLRGNLQLSYLLLHLGIHLSHA